eukprot:CAMPEP_0197021246 /NCGR_PEP_ID=MMETSP1384-20130603/2141_1 /TAXON_ID=29189 /ORGANISM="Ammonia sp." /LENGTH=445 /DNA_ID=CAMNT_0042449027 /DNA_START=257 /DNA_END=1594 /DNA_ORIENTATION=+
MQVQRMDLDQINDGPLKPVIGDENLHKLKGHKLSKQPAKKKNRAFGQDLTNQHRQQQGSQHAQSANADSFNYAKPKLVVVDDEQCNMAQSDDKKTDSGKDARGTLKRRLAMDTDKAKEEEEGEGEQGEEVEEEAEEEDEDVAMIEIKERELAPWDVADGDKDIFVAEYVDEIMQHLRTDEASNLNDCVIDNEFDFMEEFQKDINQRMRTVLVDWLIEVHRKFKLLPSTYYLGVNLLDRYLAKRQLHRRKLQLAGCTCLWIASKYHEIYAPEMDDFVYISDNAFTASDLMEMEIEILKTLSFTLTVPTVLNYAQRYSKISSFYLKKEREMKIISDLIMYCLEHCVLSYDLCRKLPSLLGAAAFVYSCISTKVYSVNTFKKDNLERVIGYEMEQLIPTMTQIHFTLKNAKKSKYKAVYKKYCNPKYSNIGKLNFDKLHTSFLNAEHD